MATPLVSDQRKRAMEALERRFAADKAKSLQEEQRKSLQEERRRSLQEEQRRNKKSRRNPKEDQRQTAPAVEGQVEGVPNPKINPSPSSSSKKELSPMATPLVSDQRKRAMEALERRFAADMAKSLQEEQRKSLQEERRRSLQEEQRRNKKSRRNPKEDQRQVAPAVEGQVGGAPNPKIDPSPSSSSKKGRLVYTGHAPPGESVDPAYARLSHLVHENLVGAVTVGSGNVDVVDNVVFNLLQHGDKGLKYTRGSIDMKIDKGLLLDNFVPRGGSLADARVKALKSHSKRSKKHMSMRQHRECGSFDLPKEFHSFNRFKPMHEMWKEYITELLKVSREKQLAQCLLMADLHGAFLQVVECKRNVAFKGASGIMIRETAETFGIITQEDKFRVVPKRGSVFIFQGGCWKITSYGDKLSLRNNATT